MNRSRTLQHLPTSSFLPTSLSTTILPSHTSATKFLTNRLYSKKRALAVSTVNQTRDIPSGRKRDKKGKTGMSDESKILLGIPLTGGSKGKNGEEDEGKKRKRGLLLQAEGRRRSSECLKFLHYIFSF